MQVRYATNLDDSARWDGFELRPGDIVITTPGKCGTTWMQMICALLVFQSPELPATLHELSPWLDSTKTPLDEVRARYAAQRHRRFIKTHTPLDGLPLADDVVYISVGRDPRDVARSARDHMNNMSRSDGAPRPPGLDQSEEEFFWWWIETDLPPTAVPTGLRRLVHHLDGFWERRREDGYVLLHYADLANDLEGEMRALGRRLGLEVPDERWPELVAAASFASMKERSVTTAPGDPSNWKDKKAFFKEARRGSWQHLIADDKAQQRYDQRAADIISPDLSAWLHRI